MNKEKLYKAIASAIDARKRCDATGNSEWFAKWSDRLDEYAAELPSGSGIDGGSKIDLDASTGEKIVIRSGYHHMDDGGMYDGWTEHTITVRASLIFGITLTISGPNRNDIKDYLSEVYRAALTAEIEA